MRNLLHIDTSPRDKDDSSTGHSSISKSIAATFIESWKALNSEDNIIYRDIGSTPPHFINQEWIAAVFTSDDARTADQKALLSLSDELIREVEQADIIIMSSPMYNYGMPASLKAWYDQVIRIHKTFTFDLARGDYPLAPIMSGKTQVLITSSGEFGFNSGGIRENMNHLGPHVRTLSHYLGVEQVYEINAEYQEFDDDRHRNSVIAANEAAQALAQKLSCA